MATAEVAGETVTEAADPFVRRTIEEFQERRAETWRRTRFPIVVMLAGFAYLFTCQECFDGPSRKLWSCMMAFFAVAGSIIHVTFTVKRFYRCPACEEMVRHSFIEGGEVPLDPDECPSCHARLR